MPGLLKRRPVITRFAPLAVMPAGAFAVHQLRYWLAYGKRAGAVLARRAMRTCTRWCRGWCCCWRSRWGLPARARSRVRRPPLDPAVHALVRRAVGSLRGGAWWRSTPRRSCSRGCSRRAIRAGWRGSSGTAAGGRSRRRLPLGSCLPPSSRGSVRAPDNRRASYPASSEPAPRHRRPPVLGRAVARSARSRRRSGRGPRLILARGPPRPDPVSAAPAARPIIS